MKKLIITLCLCMGGISTSQADFERGATAYDEKRYADAFKEFEADSKRGDAEAMEYLGTMYLAGQGTPKNIKKSIEYFTAAAEKGSRESAWTLSQMYSSGHPEIPLDEKKADYWMDMACQPNLDGTPSRFVAAAEELRRRKAARAGVDPKATARQSLVRLKSMYEKLQLMEVYMPLEQGDCARGKRILEKNRAAWEAAERSSPHSRIAIVENGIRNCEIAFQKP